MKKIFISALMLLLCNSAFCKQSKKIAYQVVMGYCGYTCVLPADASVDEVLYAMDELDLECAIDELYG